MGCNQGHSPCGSRDFSTVPFTRASARDSITGVNIDSITTVQRVDMESPVVPIRSWELLPDPSGTLGLGPMRVRFAAPGYASRELSFPQTCTIPFEPTVVLLPRLAP